MDKDLTHADSSPLSKSGEHFIDHPRLIVISTRPSPIPSSRRQRVLLRPQLGSLLHSCLPSRPGCQGQLPHRSRGVLPQHQCQVLCLEHLLPGMHTCLGLLVSTQPGKHPLSLLLSQNALSIAIS